MQLARSQVRRSTLPLHACPSHACSCMHACTCYVLYIYSLVHMSADFWAGYISGAAGIVIGNPLDVLKVRLQAFGVSSTVIPPSSPQLHVPHASPSTNQLSRRNSFFPTRWLHPKRLSSGKLRNFPYAVRTVPASCPSDLFCDGICLSIIRPSSTYDHRL